VKRELTIRGNTTEEKLKSVETILSRMSRKMSNKVIGILPASPVFEYAYAPDSEGVVMRRLFPASGKITKVGISFDDKGKKAVKLTFSVENSIALRSFSSSFMIKKMTDVLTVDFEIKAGDKITVQVVPEEDEKVGGIWIGFIYEISLKELSQKEFILEELERMVEEEVNYASQGEETQERKVPSESRREGLG